MTVEVNYDWEWQKVIENEEKEWKEKPLTSQRWSRLAVIMMMGALARVAMTKYDNVYDGDHGEADHTEVMRPTDSQVSLNGAAHHQEDGTAESAPGGRSFKA